MKEGQTKNINTFALTLVLTINIR